MTRTRYRIFETEYPYFMTCTIVGWVPLFARPEAVEIIFNSWRFLQQNRHFLLYGFVVLENDLHLMASSPELANDMKRLQNVHGAAADRWSGVSSSQPPPPFPSPIKGEGK